MSDSTTTVPPPNKKDECIELKNIKYKTMLMSGNILNETKVSNDISNLEKFLEDNNISGDSEPWTKLDKTIKTKKLLIYAKVYSEKNELNDEENINLISFLKDCLDKKKLQRVKDVLYDKSTGEIKEIPALSFNKSKNHFTLKNIDKRISTLKSLPPKKTNGTIKNKSDNE
jgi:hypothetical protein